jgi:uncharacterized protein
VIRTLAVLCAGLLVPAASSAQSVAAALSIGTVDTVWSATLKEKRPILIYTPPSYSDTTFTPRRYPVLYLLDGEAHFHSVTGLIQILATGVNGTYVVPEMIVVAIPNTNRMRDLSPSNTAVDHNGVPNKGFAGGGGMASFLAFIKSELIPHIDSGYRTAPYRMLVGHSLGGITSINALYTMPETFNAYVAIDPSLWWDRRMLLNQAKPFFSQRRLEGRALYVALANTLGADDSLPNGHYTSIVQFNRILETYNTSGIRYGFRSYPDDSHGSVPLIAEYDALRFFFPGYALDLQRAISGNDVLLAHYAKLSQQMGYDVRPPEAVVAMLGQAAQSLDSTRVLSLLRLNTELYPTSARSFIALGEYFASKADGTRARAAYERALALQPKNAKAAQGLVKLRGGQ